MTASAAPSAGRGGAGPSVGPVTAVLGPTNTGKTHYAMERMLAHRSGMIGFPLRLLARENYDRAVGIKGAGAVALITGEEKILPPGARYFICTVEAMPTERPVECAVVDEVQLAADPERGHVFTDRLLRLRGQKETIFIGAETIRPILRALVPEAEIVSRPRFSRLVYAGPKKVTRLPARTAVIGFAASEVYSLAELMRRRRGGTAVIMGALSPRTRNAQVEMYQSGDVDYLVATDAIGMGLNMDIDHIAFSRLTKFDGRVTRGLNPAEVGQIAGRAGRHTKDGSFGTTAGADPLQPEVIEAVESHDFAALKYVYWRNADLDMGSVDALLASLMALPDRPVLAPAREAEDFLTLSALAKWRDLQVRGAADVALLWDVCQIPDFRKILSESHVRLTARIYADLRGKGHISSDWMARQVDRVDRTGGDIGTLVGRISEIRTWTYVSHRADWFDEPLHWQERTRRIEDKLSDALHDRLTERFVDKRTAVLVKRLREKDDLIGAVASDGEVTVEGLPVGHLHGFSFEVDPLAQGDDARALRSAATRALRRGLEDRLRDLEAAPDGDLSLADDGTVFWSGAPVATLDRGAHPLRPVAVPVIGEAVGPEMRDAIARRVEVWLRGPIAEAAGPLVGQGEGLSGAARGVLFQLAEALGCLPRAALRDQLAGLDKAGRAALAGAGVRLGRHAIYVEKLMHPATQKRRAILWQAWRGTPQKLFGRKGPPTAFAPDAAVETAALHALGYLRMGNVAVRADRLEALDRAAGKLAEQGSFSILPALADTVGCKAALLRPILEGIGYVWIDDGLGGAFQRVERAGKPDGKGKGRGKTGTYAKARKRRAAKRPSVNPCSPFAVLKELTGRQ